MMYKEPSMEHNLPEYPGPANANVWSLPSLTEQWSRRHDLAPMPWSLSITADLLWNVFPCLRPAIRSLIIQHIDSAVAGGDLPRVDYGDDTPSADQLTLPEEYDYITHVLKPNVLDLVAEGGASADMSGKLCRYLRLLFTFSGESEATVRRYAEEIVEDIGTSQGKNSVRTVDPELAGYIQSRLGLWMAD